MAGGVGRNSVMFERAELQGATFGGVIGERVNANRRNWLRVVPLANPGMVTMFDHKHSVPREGPPPDGEPEYGHWLPWSGEFVGKYLISAVQDLRMTHDRQLKSTVTGVVDDLIRFQEPDGYLGPFSREPGKNIDQCVGGQWVGGRCEGGHDAPSRILGNNWDVWGHYHCLLGLYEWYRYSGDQRALAAWFNAAHCIATTLGYGKILELAWVAQNLVFGHVAALLYQETRASLYLDLVHMFAQAWKTVPNGGDYVAKLQPSGTRNFYAAMQMPNQQYEPRWERLHSLQAVGELFRITGDDQYKHAYINAWQGIRDFDRHSTGGFSSLEVATGNPYDPRPIETCGTIAWMALTIDMLRLTGSPEAADELELSTWNAVLGAQSPDGRWWTYNTPMGGITTTGLPIMWPFWPAGGHYPEFAGNRIPAPYDLAWQEKQETVYLSCCAANGPRGLGMLSEWAVMAASDGGIVVNFYGPSQISVRKATNVVTIAQDTDYPRHGTVKLVVLPTFDESFAIQLRIPSWSTSTTLAVNATSQGAATAGRYHRIERTWRRGDTITLDLDLRPRPWIGADPPPDKDPGSINGARGRIALYRGPILLAYDDRADIYSVDTVPRIAPSAQLTLDESTSGQQGRILRVITQTDDGDIRLDDFASAGMPSAPPLQLNDVQGRVFQFGRRGDEYPLAERMRLLADGTTQGYTGPGSTNESRWGWEDGMLTFYTPDGTASTRFVWEAWENGFPVLRGRSEFVSVVHELREVDMSLDGKLFRFSRVERGEVLVPVLRLAPGGVIEGSNNDNERSWAREGDALVFKGPDGTVTTRFTNTRTGFGRVRYEGQFRFPPAGTTITHRLQQIDLEVTDKIWQFRRIWPQGTRPNDIPERISIRLHNDGTIESDQLNESYWVFDGDNLVFLNQKRIPTTRFRFTPDLTDDVTDCGRMIWTGTFLYDSRIIHKLVEWSIDLTWSARESGRYISWFPSSN